MAGKCAGGPGSGRPARARRGGTNYVLSAILGARHAAADGSDPNERFARPANRVMAWRLASLDVGFVGIVQSLAEGHDSGCDAFVSLQVVVPRHLCEFGRRDVGATLEQEALQKFKCDPPHARPSPKVLDPFARGRGDDHAGAHHAYDQLEVAPGESRELLLGQYLALHVATVANDDVVFPFTESSHECCPFTRKFCLWAAGWPGITARQPSRCR